MSLTWKEISDEGLLAAEELRTRKLLKSCVSRAYYSTYSLITSTLEGKVVFPTGKAGPTHANLPDLILSNLPLSQNTRHEVKKAVKRLYEARIQADYSKYETTERDVVDVMRDVSFVRRSITGG